MLWGCCSGVEVIFVVCGGGICCGIVVLGILPSLSGAVDGTPAV